MKQIEIKKLWKGCASIRDYIVNECIQNGEELEIKFKKERMTLTPSVLIKGTTDGNAHQSQFNDKTYILIDFTWIPDKRVIEFDEMRKIYVEKRVIQNGLAL